MFERRSDKLLPWPRFVRRMVSSFLLLVEIGKTPAPGCPAYAGAREPHYADNAKQDAPDKSRNRPE